MIIDPGTKILNYRITEVLGHGGMGRVYKAVHLSLDRIVAIKAIHPKLLNNDSIIKRFYHEARIQARLNHPNIVTVYDFFEQNGNYFIVMEFVEGESISKVISHQGAFEIRLGITIFRHVLDGISYAHKQGVIHKDIKTSNFLLTSTDVKITDFGIAQIIGDSQNNGPGDNVIGTPKYMSPEMILGKSDVDHRADIYSLGVTLYEFLTGRVPFGHQNTSDMEIRRMQLDEKPPPPGQYNPALTDRIEKIILKSLEKQPERRYQSVDEFIAAVNGIDLSKPNHFLDRIFGMGTKHEKADQVEKQSKNIKEKTVKDRSGEKNIPGSAGSLEKTDFSYLLSTYHYDKSTGCLNIDSDTNLKIYFSEGYVTSLQCDDPDLLLGKLLVENKKITQIDQKKAVGFSASQGLKTGEALIRLGKLSPHDLSYTLELQLKLKLLNGFRLKDGTYSFKPGLKNDAENFFRIDPIQVIYDAINGDILDPGQEMELFASDNVIHPSELLISKMNEISLSSPREYKFIKMIKGPQTVKELVSGSPLDEHNSLKMIRFLLHCRLISIELPEDKKDSYVSSQEETVILSGEQIREELKNVFKTLNTG